MIQHNEGRVVQQMDAFARNHPVTFVLVSTLTWFALLMVIMGIASGAFRRPYGDANVGMTGRLAVTACTLLLLWHLGWLEAAGVSRLGSRRVWLLALGGLLYFTGASLYSFYGKVAFDFSSLTHLPDSHTVAATQFAAGLSEEALFRGLALYALARAWRSSRLGTIGSVAITSLLFAALHITQVFTYGVSLSSALLLTLETGIVSIWWGALVVLGGSIWPAVMLHFLVNSIVAVQGLTVPMVQPDIVSYRLLLWFSMPLGVLAIGLLGASRTSSRPAQGATA